MSSIAPPVGAPSFATTLVDRVRREWRRGVVVRGLLASLAAATGLAVLLVLFDQIASLPATVRAILRLAVPALLLAGLVHTVRRAWPGPSDARLALLAEERRGLGHELSTALATTGSGPVATAFRERSAARLAAVHGTVIGLGARRTLVTFTGAVVATVVLVAFVPGGSAEIGARWIRLVDDPATGIGPNAANAIGRTAEDAVVEIRDLRIVIRPPAYTAQAEHLPAAIDPIVALAGSTVHITGHAPAGTTIRARILGGADPAVTMDGAGFAVSHRLQSADRGIEIVAAYGSDVVARRVLPLDVRLDAPPVVELREPGEDLVVATPSGIVPVVASARDDHGIAQFRLAWILSRGSGESFSFTDGGAEWGTVRTEDGARVGSYALDLAALGLQPGDVLHVRAVALDANAIGGPGEGVSATRLIRIAREDGQDEATTLIGFPLEPEKDPILSQRMIVLLTERLIERAPTMDEAVFRAESDGIAREQARLRERLADIIYARTSGDEEGDSHGEAAVARPDLPALDSLSPKQREQALRELLEAASAATGQGTLEELSHDHDPDPALMVNLPLVPAFNAMYEAERHLRLADPRAALPHELRALEIIQRVREAERVYLRGRVTVPPVDVAATRGRGDVDDANPAARSAALPVQSAGRHVEAITTAAARIPSLTARDAGLLLSDLSARLLEDLAVDPRAGTLLARAATAARAGNADEARALVTRARAVLVPPAGTAPASFAEAPGSGAAARYLSRDPTGPDRIDSRPAAPFTFATARYASGDWDSGQLVPANLIHSLALYTDIPVEPEGVIVDLDSPEVFRYPFLFLTGHLPVRFTTAEAANLRAYVERGGFIFVDDHNHDIDGAFHRTVVAEIERIFGADALEPLPADHELYAAFFPFDDGPPTTSHELNGWGDGLIHEHLFAVLRPDGRIGLLFSNKDYTSEWSYHVQNKRFLSLDNTRFGVNVIVYALTR